jgi:hypothetical protein
MNCVLSAQTLSKDYPFLKKINATAKVSFTSSGDYFYYSYVLKNHEGNKGSIQEFEIDISRPNNSILLDTTGLKFASKLEEKWFKRDFPPRQQWIVPVAFLRIPGREWLAMLSNKPNISISADTLFIKPGNSVGDIIMMSKGLPGIRSFIVEPDFEEVLYFPNIEDTTAHMSIAQMDSIREAVNYHGWTIGPTAPPIDFIFTIWCDTLHSYTRQSVQLGWLKDKNAEKRIDFKLDIAKRLLEIAKDCAKKPKQNKLLDEATKAIKEDETVLKKEYGRESVPTAEEVLRETPQIVMDEKNLKELEQYENEITRSPKDRKLNEAQCINLCEKTYTWLAIKMLESLVREVEILNRLTEKSKREYITSEAYALLKYNTEYLIEQLKKK